MSTQKETVVYCHEILKTPQAQHVSSEDLGESHQIYHC